MPMPMPMPMPIATVLRIASAHRPPLEQPARLHRLPRVIELEVLAKVLDARHLQQGMVGWVRPRDERKRLGDSRQCSTRATLNALCWTSCLSGMCSCSRKAWWSFIT